MSSVPDRNLALELVRVTEAAALASARWIGRGEKEAADQAAVDAMRLMLDTVAMDGKIVIGEGEKDQAPMLYNGESVGSGVGPQVDVAVDPLEGTELTAMGLPNAISVIAASEVGTIFFPASAFYMEKIAVGAEARNVVALEASPTENVRMIAEAKKKAPDEVSVVVLNRERNQPLIDELRGVGAKITLIPHGDTAPAIAAAARGSAVDAVMGVGGSTEGVIAAAALRCLGGELLARVWPRSEQDREELIAAGAPVDRVFGTKDLVGGEEVFVAATGITPGALLDGVRYEPWGAITHSIVMRAKSGTFRRISADHSFEKLRTITGDRYS